MGKRRWMLVAIGLAVLIAATALLPLADWLSSSIDWARENRLGGSAALLLAFTVGPVLLLPGSLFAMTAGYLYGLSHGAAIAVLGSAFGALAAFLSGRTLARAWVRGKIEQSPRLRALDGALGERSFLIVVLTRLSLLIPYNLLNYFYGVTAVRTLPYFLATAIGMIPAVVFYTYAGTLAAGIDDLVSGELDTGVAGKIYLIGGFLVVLLTVFLIHRIATGVLRSRIDENDD